MTKEKEAEDKKLDDKKQPVAEKPETSKKEVDITKEKSAGISIVGVLNIIIIILMIAMAWFFWDYLKKSSGSQKTTIASVVQKSTMQLEQDIVSLKAVEATHFSSLKKDLIPLQQQQLAVEKTLNNISSVIADSRNSVRLQEARYLIYMANQRLQFAQDVDAAIIAMSRADNLLAGENNSGMLVVRKQLAKELLSLKLLAQIDVESTAISLIAMAEAVDTLPLNKEIRPGEFNKGSAEFNFEDIAFTDWQLLLEKVWAEFRKLLIIQHKDEVAIPMLMIENEYLLRNNLQLKLEMVRVALLNKQQLLYRASIKTAAQWLDTYFDKTDARVVTFSEKLDEFKALSVNPALPDISKSLKLLRIQIKKQAVIKEQGDQ